jgi:hypothetical protein
MNDEKQRATKIATPAQKTYWAPALALVASTMGMLLTWQQFLKSEPKCGQQDRHRDVFTAEKMKGPFYTGMIRGNKCPPVSAFMGPIGGGSLRVCPGSQYVRTKVYKYTTDRRVQLENMITDNSRAGYRQVVYSQNQILLMNSGLWHFGEANTTGKTHMRMFAMLERGQNGVALRHLNPKTGAPEIEVIAVDKEKRPTTKTTKTIKKKK